MDKFIFRKEDNEYSKTIQPIQDYFQQMTYYINKRYGYSIQDATKILKDMIKEKGMVNPNVKYRCKDENGDIIESNAKLIDYITSAKKNNEIIVPSYTTYINPKIKKSLHSEFIAGNVKKRSKHKKLAFKAKQEGDDIGYSFNNVLQKTMKIFNNSLSGAYGDKSTVVYNPSSHYTLTSITRCVASIGNAITESVVAGNKHLRDKEITYAYITSIISKLHKDTIELAIHKYNLYIPTTDDIMETLIIPNIQYYWRDPIAEQDIKNYIDKLEPYEKVGVLYTNDMWSMKKYNDAMMRDLIGSMSKQVIGLTTNPDYLTKSPEGIEILSKIINADLIKGMNLDYDKMKDTDVMNYLCSTAKNIMDVLGRYKLLFRAFLVTDILPISIAYLKDMLRSVIILSDTDSTCGSYDQWVKWYFGKIVFSSEATAIAAAVMTINSQLIDHGLKILSNNMNVPTESGELIKMKNEFFWPIFTVANVNKHYYASTAIQEGNVYNKPELELKGVHFLASNVSKDIVSQIHHMLEELNTTISNNGKISLYSYCKRIADMERDIIKRAKEGDISIFRKDKIKSKETYKNDLSMSPYFHHMLWEEIFAPMYGEPGKPPYNVIKIPTILNTKNELEKWLSSLQDQELANKLSMFLKQHNKTMLGTIRPPVSVVNSSGIPIELMDIMDVTRIVEDNMLAGYYFLETLGMYKKEGRLLCDMGY